MNEETALVLKDLAAKLGTTTEYLWTALLKQALITGITDAIIFSVWLITGAFFCLFAWDRTKWKDKDNMNIARFATVGFLVLTLIISMDAGPYILSALFNPEYWAIQHIVETIRIK